MNQLEEAQAICDQFIPKHPEGDGYVYVFLGKIKTVLLHFECIDSVLYQSTWEFEIDYTQKSFVHYFGEGVAERINHAEDRLTFAPKDCRLILRGKLHREDRQNLERLLIHHFGRRCNPADVGGILANISDGIPGPRHTVLSSTAIINRSKGRSKGAKTNTRSVVLFDYDKTVIATGLVTEVARTYDLNPSIITQVCLRHQNKRTLQVPVLNQRLLACYAEDFDSYIVPKKRKRRINAVAINYRGISIETGEVVIGTASEIAKILGWPYSYNIHCAASPDYPHHHQTKGWIFQKTN